MDKRLLAIFVAMTLIVPFVLFGCKGKVEKTSETTGQEVATSTTTQEETQVTQPIEPAQTVATETIPPTATPPAVEKPAAMPPVQEVMQNKDKDIQRALKNAGFYTGTVDGKVGPKTKKAIEEFQKAKGLKVDGKVGSKTWSELAKYLTQPQQ